MADLNVNSIANAAGTGACAGITTAIEDNTNALATASHVKNVIGNHLTSGFGARSLGGVGYQRLPGGLLIQWGSTVVNTNSAGDFVVNYPTAFATNGWYSTTAVDGDGTARISLKISATTNPHLGFVGNCSFTNGTVRINWIAFGTV